MRDATAADAPTTEAPRIGFIGTGLIGTPMVERMLDCGLSVTVWNRTPEKAASLIARGATGAASARELAASVDIVCLCLTNTAAVHDVLFGERGIAEVLRASQLVIDFSSIAPDATVHMAQQLRTGSGAAMLDCPVSGGLPAARAGTLIVFAGGDAVDIARGAPVFAALSQKVTHMGGHGAGQLAKSCNQMIVGCNLMVIAEMLAFAKRSGVDASRMPEALAGGFADSLPLKIFGPRMAAGIDTPRVGALATFRKDIDQVVRLAADVQANVPMTQRAAELMRAAGSHADVGSDADISRIVRMYAEMPVSAAAL
jgi:3-hydroxyisobutyrate dehydrogenase